MHRIKKILRPTYKLYKRVRLDIKPIINAANLAHIKKAVRRSINMSDLGRAKDELRQIVEEAWNQRFILSVIDRVKDIELYKKKIEYYNQQKDNMKPRIAIYTAISGDYDSLKLPEILEPQFDYFVFTDNAITNTGIYNILPFQYFNEDNSRTARFAKTHPHFNFDNYDIAIWIDASILITGDILPLISQFIDSGKALGVIPHPARKTVKQEFEACIKLQKDDPLVMDQQLNFYESTNYSGDKLYESGFLAFNLKNKASHQFLDIWWSQIDKHSKRDQLSLGYSIEKSGIDYFCFTTPPNSIRNHPDFVLAPHGSQSNSIMNLLSSRLGSELSYPSSDKQNYATVKSSRLSSLESKKVDVVVCVHNAYEEVVRCLKSIEKHRTDENLNLIIVDDGSDKNTADYLNKFSEKRDWVKLLKNRVANGYTRAANKGIKKTTGDLVILLNSDTVVTKNWYEKMADALYSNPKVGIVGPLSSAASVQSIPDFRSKGGQTAINNLPRGVSIEDMNEFCEEWSSSKFVPRVPLVHGFCFGISRELIDNIGGFDEKNFPRGYGEENDYCFRAADAGFGLVIATHTYVFHEKSKSYQDSTRLKLMNDGAKSLRKIHGERRVNNAVRSMVLNPTLCEIREKSKKLY